MGRSNEMWWCHNWTADITLALWENLHKDAFINSHLQQIFSGSNLYECHKGIKSIIQSVNKHAEVRIKQHYLVPRTVFCTRRVCDGWFALGCFLMWKDVWVERWVRSLSHMFSVLALILMLLNMRLSWSVMLTSLYFWPDLLKNRSRWRGFVFLQYVV